MHHEGNLVKNNSKLPKTVYIARHYGWALNNVFNENHSHVIVLEDDMIFSKDFLEIFVLGSELMYFDSTIFCVSSWNDYGHKQFNLDENLFFRTEYFPGLGWVINKDIWNELKDVWPHDAWDYWMRLDDVMDGRDCIAPEISRNRNIGKKGSTVNQQWFVKHVEGVQFFRNR
eukprot:UN26205